MRLINIRNLQLEEFFEPPPYAILSHRWIGREITYEQFINPTQRQGPGFDKIARFCSLLRERPTFLSGSQRADYHPGSRGVEWAWVDTCCIDKRSSAELSESINSMWKWYRCAEYCVAWLHDVRGNSFSSMGVSDWFSRGWTLQELLAPMEVFFHDSQWRLIGTRSALSDHISRISRISAEYLRTPGNENVRWVSVAKRMSWASMRKTTKSEDEAYCLFGLFGVNLPLLYGEGGRHAFVRLQEEIIRTSDDESILAWKQHSRVFCGFLAVGPSSFSHSGGIEWINASCGRDLRVTKKGVEMRAVLLRLQNGHTFLPLDCVDLPANNTLMPSRCLLALEQRLTGAFIRRGPGESTGEDRLALAKGDFQRAPETTVYLSKDENFASFYSEPSIFASSLCSELVSESSWKIF